MGKQKVIINFILFVGLLSCNSKDSSVYLELNNSELEREISIYMSNVKFKNEQNSIIHVYCKDIDDSTSQYVIGAEIDPNMIKDMPYNFVCLVDNRKVFFTMLAGIDKNYFGKNNMFILKNDTYLEFVKNNFPKEYERIKHKKTDDVYLLYEPEMYYLTFTNNKLVKKEIRRGVPWF